MKGLDREFREAVRLFVRSPAFVAAVVLPMALALGANTALFTMIGGCCSGPCPIPSRSGWSASTGWRPSEATGPARCRR